MKTRFAAAVPFAMALFCSALNAGLIINPQFDASITSDPNAAAIIGSINSAISVYEGTFLNPVTVNILFQEFTGSSGLGQSDIGFIYAVNYKAFYDQLVATNANPDAIAGLNANGGNGDTNGGLDPVIHRPDGDILIKSANARALGFGAAGLCFVTPGDTTPASNSPNHCGSMITSNRVDGIITVQSAITTPPNGPGGYSLIAVLEHEIDEVLGLGSDLPNGSSQGTIGSNYIAPEDLWRFDGNGNRAFTVNCASPGRATFSLNGTTNLTDFNNACNGADFGDWASSATAQVQDAFGTPGSNPTLGTNEIQALSAVGYQTAAPEPSGILLLLSGIAACAIVRRYRS